MISAELILERLVFIQQCLRELYSLRALSRQDFQADPRNFAAAESFLRRALEAVFDIGRHILTRTGAPGLAQEYKSIARALGDLGIVSAETSGKLAMMAGYRNRLVHLYHQVSPEELLMILKNDLGDLESFIEEIRRWLDADSASPR